MAEGNRLSGGSNLFTQSRIYRQHFPCNEKLCRESAGRIKVETGVWGPVLINQNLQVLIRR